jgi:hypothetical protein
MGRLIGLAMLAGWALGEQGLALLHSSIPCEAGEAQVLNLLRTDLRKLLCGCRL